MKATPLDVTGPSVRVTRTFAFLDLCGFTDFVDRRGDDEGVDELRALRSTVRDVAPLCGVRVDKWLGDGVMLVGVESEPLVTAAMAIAAGQTARGRLAVRGGIASGAVILVEGDEYVGRAVNIAARLCDRADAGEILAATWDLRLPDDVEAVGERAIPLKGLSEEVPVAVLGVGTLDRRSALAAGAGAWMTLVEGLTRPVRHLRPLRPRPPD
ncbi:MAG: adenylate/guanylate cyclase protein [Acidimicrobiales bacterium]|jgi:adenylate cyclase|nr:adenylate/guanylate cyclase protein [Acidimicrobiales bacterium]